MKLRWVVLTVFCICLSARAEDGSAAFSHTLSLGLTITDGNSDTFQAQGSFVTEGEKEAFGSLRAGWEGNYGESKTDGERETTLKNVRVFAGAKKTLSPRTFASLDTFGLYDDLARIDYRIGISPGLGVYVIKGDTSKLFFEAGPSYVWEKIDRTRDDFLAVRLAERFEYTLSETALLWQAIEYIPKADQRSDYLLNAELGLKAALNHRMNLRVVLQNRYDSTPAEDVEKNDLALVAGISLSL